MSTIVSDVTAALAARLRAEREARGWPVAELAQRSGVSRAMISKIERAEASPTAALLGKLSGAFGLTLSALLARAEGAMGGRLSRRAAQTHWTDPATHYRRRAVSPPTGGPLEIVEVELPPGAEVSFPAAAYTFRYHQILVLSGTLTLIEGGIEHTLAKGDCLELGAPAPVTYANRTRKACVYLVQLVRA
jgi:transcriptional regulator with XRE-family HTH domain